MTSALIYPALLTLMSIGLISLLLFYILPRMSPDGAEAVLQTGAGVRTELERQAFLPILFAHGVCGNGHEEITGRRDRSRCVASS